MARRLLVLRLAVGAGLLALCVLGPRLGAMQTALPASLSDREFWALSERLSEPNGYFLSDNLLSNETTVSTVAASLAQHVKSGGAYLGVGPEQNFTYIAAIRPKIAFITDIRRGNWHLHMMYKALFELSADRADFVRRLFTKRERAAGLSALSTAADSMNAYWDAPVGDEAAFRKNFQAVRDLLVKKHRLALSKEDLAGIAYVYRAFWWYGPRINYGNFPTYADLMIAPDAAGSGERSYLATEQGFAFLKDLQRRNLVVPVVGDFSGPKALRGVGQYLRDHGATVTAFYVSNVEHYLFGSGAWQAFCGNVATMPLDESSVFIRPLGASFVITMSGAASTGDRVVIANGRALRLGSGSIPASAADRLESPFGAMKTETSDCSSR